MFEICTVGKRLRYIRKLYHIRQEEITGDVVTRNLISIIENDKANLTRKVAEVVVEQINRHPNAIRAGFTITVDALMESPEEQIQKQGEIWLSDIQSGRIDVREEQHRNQLFEFLELASQYDLYELQFNLHWACFLKLTAPQELALSLDHLLNAYEKSHRMEKNKRSIDVLINIGATCMMLGRNEEALFYFKRLEESHPKMPVEDRVILYNNRSLALGSLGRYEAGLAAIEKSLLLELDNPSIREETQLSRASFLVSLERYSEALEAYEGLLETVRTDRNRSLVLAAILNVLTIIKDQERLLLYLEIGEKSLDALSRVDGNVYVSRLCYRIGLAHKLLDHKDQYLNQMKKALDWSIRDNRLASVRQIIEDLLETFTRDKDIGEIRTLKQKLIESRRKGILGLDDPIIWKSMQAMAQFKMQTDLSEFLLQMQD